MYKLESYLKLLRIKHWIKNVFIFIPLIFSKNLFDKISVINSLKAFILFSIGTSLVYVINDICDIEKDKKHPRKKMRPLASGAISIKEAKLLVLLMLVLLIILMLFGNFKIALNIIVLLYIVMNILYSFKLKNYPIIDVLIIAIGFIFRIMVGGIAIDVLLSKWLFVTVFSLSCFLGFGKRKKEKIQLDSMKGRKVLDYYNIKILEEFSNIFSTSFLIFYCLYSFENKVEYFYLTIPLVVYGLLRYILLLKQDNIEGDPTEILLNDFGILGVCIIYILMILILLY